MDGERVTKKVRLLAENAIMYVSSGFSPHSDSIFTFTCDKSPTNGFTASSAPQYLHSTVGSINYTAKPLFSSAFYTHALGIIDAEKDEISLLPVSLVRLECSVEKRVHGDDDIKKKDIEEKKENAESRDFHDSTIDEKVALGQAFGSKRMQKIIQNRALQAANAQLSVQVGAAVVEQVKEAVEHAKGSSIGAIEEENIYGEAKKGLENGDLPVPPQNIQTTNVEEVYSLSDIVSAEELSVIHVKLLLRAPDERSRANIVYRNSRYINDRLGKALVDGKKNKRRIKLLYYASLLMAFYTNYQLVSKKDLLIKKLGDPPEILVDHLITRFSEPSRSGINHEIIVPVITSYGIDKILCYLFALCLIIDEFSVDMNLLAQDLSLSTQKCKELFKILGCKIQGCTEAQRISLNLSKAEAKTYKRAVLTLPLEVVTKKRRRLR
ncbi:DNA-directed RNA polymerase I subunit RPA49 [Pneumocystis jirovecii RU7]|uniref:RNA polymerase I associated factor, A49-like protein n=1 Tax=Pneumocystis jirovecii (strain RU7) TaxID=1408657 RepID=A0A0W4ZFQ4_PNEJ7|nr:DNA-directed RNA polymerase I subunit RPA49 [Pneumocystis jirovecii RU7]KTW27214.1 hypothetical protein T551_03208 [Pneumocystis jirovecii RU7]